MAERYRTEINRFNFAFLYYLLRVPKEIRTTDISVYCKSNLLHFICMQYLSKECTYIFLFLAIQNTSRYRILLRKNKRGCLSRSSWKCIRMLLLLDTCTYTKISILKYIYFFKTERNWIDNEWARIFSVTILFQCSTFMIFLF